MESLRHEGGPGGFLERVREQARYTAKSSWSEGFAKKRGHRGGESAEIGDRSGSGEALAQTIDPRIVEKLEQHMKQAGAAEGVVITSATSARFRERMKALVYRVISTSADGRDYLTPSQRGGNSFRGIVVLPEALAQEVFEKIQHDPEFVRVLFEELDSEMMADQKQHMPASQRIVVAPEGTLSSKSETKPTIHDVPALRDAA